MIGPHAGLARLNKTLSMVDGLPSLKFTKWKFLCPGCVIGKMKTPPVPRKSINRPAALALPNEVKGIVLLCFDMIESS